MARKKPASNKQKKAALQEQRAMKRGDIPAGTPREHTNIKLKPSTSAMLNSLPSRSEALGTVDWQARRKARELQSAFTGLSKAYVEAANRRAFNTPLPRPLPPSAVLYQTPVQLEENIEVKQKIKELDERLWCPIRPKWRHSMTKKELDRNEEMQFAKWLEEMDATHREYMSLPLLDDEPARGNDPGEGGKDSNSTATTRSPSFFERNLSVWRQLWRVTEQSQIILVMIDVRCPPVHFPASLRSYLRSLVTPVTRRRKEQGVSNNNTDDGGTPTTPTTAASPPVRPKGAPTGRKRVILCLTKTDLVDAEATTAWTRWCKDWWKYGYDMYNGDEKKEEDEDEKEQEIEVVSVRSYADQPVEEQKTRHRHIPQIPGSTLNNLLEALEKAHIDLLEPPKALEGQPEKLERWRNECRKSVKEVVNWEEFKQQHEVVGADAHAHGEGELVEREGKEGDIVEVDENAHDPETAEEHADREADTLTIGLIGQPNCGKSSLLNALMGRSRVRASKTPGKTKHFQSLYWSKDVRIVDCPGLVLPSLTSVEMQVQAGILPISQVSSVASCIHHIACALPLEKALNVASPARWAEERDRRLRIQSRITTRRRDEHEDREDGRQAEPVVYARAAEGREEGVGEERWTAGDILQGWAEYRGYVTAKAGRPDTNRAGNEILRTVVEGRIPWRYLPSTGTFADLDQELVHLVGSNGIWLPHQTEAAAALIPHDDDGERHVSSEEEFDDDVEGHVGRIRVGEESESSVDTEDEEEEKTFRSAGLGVQSRFAALSLGVEEGVSDEEDDEGDEESVTST